MPRIRTNSSTPETRRRELLLSKSTSTDENVKIVLEHAKTIVRKSNEDDSQQYLSDEENVYRMDECKNSMPCIYRASGILSLNDNQIENDIQVSTTMENLNNGKNKLLSSTTYHLGLTSNDDEPHYISCLEIKPNYTYNYCDYRRRRRTSSLPSSTIDFDLSMSKKVSNYRSSSLNSLKFWQNNPHKIINLFNRQYHCQPISEYDNNRIILANSTHIDVYNVETGQCDERLCFQSSKVNHIALCYNQYKDELLVASTSNLYIYNLQQAKVTHDILLPGFSFSLDYNSQIRYLTCNMSSIYHGYFSYTSTCTSTVISRLSQYGLKHVCDLEFDDGTMHGLHAFEHYIGIVIRYGRYSSKQYEDYCLYVYDALLDQQYYTIDLNDIGCITCLTGYERTLDWILCDYEKQRILFVNQESIEYVQFKENIYQCKLINETNYLAVWLRSRIFVYRIE